jgi:hypothetical protein
MNTVWVWYGMKYWLNPTFSNHLKARWHHYKFCNARAKVFNPQRYLDRWQKDLQETIIKRPGDQVHSHGFHALLEMMKDKSRLRKMIEFLESKDLTKSIDELIRELNIYQIEEGPDAEESMKTKEENDSVGPLAEITEIPGQQSQEKILTEPKSFSAEILPRVEPIQEETAQAPSHAGSETIVTRAYVIAADIHHELYRTSKEYEELKSSRPKYVEFLRQQFRVEKLAGRIYELRNFDFRPILKDKTETRRGQLKPQLEQIAKNPSIFGEKVSQYVEDLLKKYFENHTTE